MNFPGVYILLSCRKQGNGTVLENFGIVFLETKYWFKFVAFNFSMKNVRRNEKILLNLVDMENF